MVEATLSQGTRQAPGLRVRPERVALLAMGGTARGVPRGCAVRREEDEDRECLQGYRALSRFEGE